MITAALILVPLLAGLATIFIRGSAWRRTLLVATAVLHLSLSAVAWVRPQEAILGGWLQIDPLGLIFLSLISILFFASAIYGVGYLHSEEPDKVDFEEGFLFANEPEAIFIGCLFLFLAAMTLVTLCQHLGLLWVGIEATTLASAPLIYFHRHHRSLEATWKYIMICSVGIALALLGNFLLSVAARAGGSEHLPLIVSTLNRHAGQMNHQWLKAAFLFFLVGYGTKMGLAPMHTWLPDAHSESPSMVSALLSGALLNCAFLGILRVHSLCIAAGEASFSRELLVVFGLMSMGIATLSILRQRDFKRMLAYSSVEHVGVLALGVGLGGVGVFGSMLHAINHSLTKAALFLVAGIILATYHTRTVSEIRGLLRIRPITAVLWIAGFLSITGSPPFGTFLSEFTILKAALDAGRYGIATLYLVLLSLIFIAMVNIVLKMAQGQPPEKLPQSKKKEAWWEYGPAAVLLLLVVILGSYVPPRLGRALNAAALRIDSSQVAGGDATSPSHPTNPMPSARIAPQIIHPIDPSHQGSGRKRD